MVIGLKCSEQTRKIQNVRKTIYLSLQHLGIPGDLMERAAKAVAVERRLEVGLVL